MVDGQHFDAALFEAISQPVAARMISRTDAERSSASPSQLSHRFIRFLIVWWETVRPAASRRPLTKRGKTGMMARGENFPVCGPPV